jgi:hypothetical protein
MKLITEVYDQECSVLTEASENGKKNYFIEGIFMQGDIKNRNGRIYPSNVLEKEMKRYNDQFIKTKRALGELGHPNGPQINGDRVSHLITEMRRDGSNFYGKAKILSTPMGEIVKTLIDEGVYFGVSTRGLGTVKPSKNGIMEVQDDFHLATVDIVTDPSGPNCFVNGIMENTEYYFDIAASSWLPRNESISVSEVIETATESFVERAEFETAMRKLDELYTFVKDIKESYKPSKKAPALDESKALKVFENYISTLNKR